MCGEGHVLGTMGICTSGGRYCLAQISQNSVIRPKKKKRLTNKYMTDTQGRNEQTRARIQSRNNDRSPGGLGAGIRGLQERDCRGKAETLK